MNLLSSAFNYLIPKRCAVCRTPSEKLICFRCKLPDPTTAQNRCPICFLQNITDPDEGICTLCEYFPLHFKQIRYLWDYRKNVTDCIHAMKYNPDLLLCRELGRKLAEYVMNSTEIPDILCPVPASRLNLQKRGFDQGKILALEVHRLFKKIYEFSIPVLNLTTSPERKSQATMKPKQRLRNARGVFSLKHSLPQNCSILIIDDVATTGASSLAVADLLLHNGAKSVSLYTLARSPHWESYRQAFANRVTNTVY